LVGADRGNDSKPFAGAAAGWETGGVTGWGAEIGVCICFCRNCFQTPTRRPGCEPGFANSREPAPTEENYGRVFRDLGQHVARTRAKQRVRRRPAKRHAGTGVLLGQLNQNQQNQQQQLTTRKNVKTPTMNS